MRVHRPRLTGLQLGATPRDPIVITIPGFDGAACAGSDYPDLWFSNEISGELECRVAINICNECPAKTQCLQYALDNDITHGIWGGVTASARNAIQRRLRYRQGRSA